MTDEERAALVLRERDYFRVYRQAYRSLPENIERERARQRPVARASYAKNRDLHRLRVGAARYGMSFDDYKVLRDRCESECCFVCGSQGSLQIDHCHTTGEIRGLLCGYCNSALGWARDDADRLRGLIAYLSAPPGV